MADEPKLFPPTPLPQKHSWRDRLTFSGCALAVIITGIAIFAGVLGIHHWRLSRAIKAEYASLKAKGRPVTLEDCVRHYRENVNSSSNAAPAYDRTHKLLTNAALFTNYTEISRSYKTDPRPFTEDELKKVEQLLAVNRAAYEELPKCFEHARAYYHLEWDQGFAMLLRHLARVRDLQRFIEVHGLYSIQTGEIRGALTDVESLVKVSDAMADEPLFISCLMRMRGHVTAARLTQQILGKGDLPADELRRVQTLFEQLDVNQQFIASLDMERRMTGDLFEASTGEINQFINSQSSEGAAESDELMGGIGMFMLRANGAVKGDYYFFLRNISAMQNAAMKPDRARFDEIQKIEKKVNEDRALVVQRTKKLASQVKVKLLSGMFLPGLVKGFNRLLQHDLEVRLVAMSAAVQRFQETKGHWPTATGDIVPEFAPKDFVGPYTGKPFLVRQTESGVEVVGLNAATANATDEANNTRVVKLTRRAATRN